MSGSNSLRNLNTACSFCRKSYHDVGPLVEGPGEVYICGECVGLCQSIIVQERRRRSSGAVLEPTLATVRAKLAKIVPGQNNVTQALVEAAFSHYTRLDRSARNLILLTGPTRSSKLFLARALAHALEVAFAETDMPAIIRADTRQSMALLNQLLDASDFEVDTAQRGVIYVEGIDDRAIQEWLPELWKAIEDEARRLPVPMKTNDILFLGGGEFARLDEAITQLGRHPEQPVNREVLRAFGMAAHLVNLLPAIVRVAPLDEETLGQMAAWVDFSRIADGDETEVSRQ